MIHQLNIYGKDKVEVAIDRLKTYEPPEGYWLAFSGGKDSSVIKALADMAGVKYTAHYNVTSVDPPELVRFIKREHPDVIFEYPRDKNGNRITMWNLIPREKMPPTRIMRYCCRYLKEGGGRGHFVITGVRWGESVKRKNNRHLAEVQGKQGKKVYSSDNVEDAPTFKFCHQEHKRILNPIVDWSTEEVWEFINYYNTPYCKLYDQGYKRLGCIGCPMSVNQRAELENNPKYKNLYLKAFDVMLKAKDDKSKLTTWQSAEDVYEWWTQADISMEDTEITRMLEELAEE